MNITDVVERVLAGDRQAYAQIVTAYQAPLFRYLSRMGLRRALAEEIAQETFLRAWIRLGAFNPRRAGFSTWLYTIAHRLALKALDRSAETRELPLAEDFDPIGGAPEPPEALALTQRREQLRTALLALPVRDRAVLALAYVDGLALTEVARIEGCTVGAVKTRLHRARRGLAALMENGCE